MPVGGMTTINVDFNWVRRGLVRAFLDEADGPITKGDIVRAIDPDGGVDRLARVEVREGDTVGLRVLPAKARMLFDEAIPQGDALQYRQVVSTGAETTTDEIVQVLIHNAEGMIVRAVIVATETLTSEMLGALAAQPLGITSNEVMFRVSGDPIEA